MSKKRKILLISSAFMVGLLLFVISNRGIQKLNIPVWSPSFLVKDYDAERPVGDAILVYDEQNKLVTKMARNVSVGDEIINGKGQEYRINNVSEKKATAKLIGYDKSYLSWVAYFDNLEEVPVVSSNNKNRVIGVYHTHSDESYEPTDGKYSIAFNGGIFKVGTTYTSGLKDKGVNVTHSMNKHDPHDNNAYVRSRRTVTELLKQNPIALFDIHRDGVPDPDFYSKKVSGENVTQMRFVLGNQNPNMEANKDFAERLMAYANKKHPGLVKELFIGKGSYNQDLLPTALLVEVGTYTNSRQKAQAGVSLLSDAVPIVLGVGGGATTSAPNQPNNPINTTTNSRGWSMALILLVVVLIGGGAFMVMSTGSFHAAGEKIKGLGNEMTGLFKPAKKPMSGPENKDNEPDNKK